MALVRGLVDGDLEGFRQEFESFLDRCPSFPYYFGTGRFFPAFFFSIFATAHNAGILDENERVYFRFDNHGVHRDTGNLKVAVLTNKFHGKQRIVRCYSICDSYNSFGARLSERERNSIEREIIKKDQSLKENLHFEQYKVYMHGKGKSQGEAIATAFEVIREEDFRGGNRFAKYSASEVNLLRQLLRNNRLTVKRIEGIHLNHNQRRQLDRLVNFEQVAQSQQRIDSFMEMLASDNRKNVSDSLREDILRHITNTYRGYENALSNGIHNHNRESEGYGFFLGFLANFSHLYTIDIDLDLSPGNSHVAFLVRRQAERENVPIVINLATGRTLSRTALNHARDHTQRLHASSFIPLQTGSRNAVCVGLNFNLNRIPFRVDTVSLQQGRFPLVQRLFECVENDQVIVNIRDFLLQHLPTEIPRNAENYNRIFDCITGFAFGSSAFDHEQVLIRNNRLQVTKHIFKYDDEGLGRRVLTIVFHAQGSDIIILHIRAYNVQQQGVINLQTLNVDGNNPRVWEISYTLNNQLELDIDPPNDLGLYQNYQNDNVDNFLNGELLQVPNAENVHDISERVMNDGWKNVDQHRELFQEISRVLMPLMGAINVNSQNKFRSILHGACYACDGPDKVITRYKVGQTYSSNISMVEGRVDQVHTEVTKQRLDLLLLRQCTESDQDTHPIGYVLKFANNGQAVAQEERKAGQQINKLMDKQRGYISITSGNEVVLSYAVFNRGAQRAEDLISIPQLYVHRLDRRGRDLRSGGLVGPESVIDENPPANLLSDETRQRLIDHFQNNRRQSSIPLFDLDNNRWVAIRYLEGNKELVIRKLRSGTDGTAHTSPPAQGILERINNILGDGNSIQDVNDLITLDFATNNNYYRYWLQQHDIPYVARARGYNFPVGNEMRFNVIGINGNQVDVLKTHIRSFKNEEGVEPRRSILIVNLGDNHWVTLVIDYRNGNYIGYYADSLGHNVLNSVRQVLEDNNVTLQNVLIDQQGNRLVQQRDGYNCGFWALENARDINEVLQNNLGTQGRDVLDAMRNSLTLNVPGLNNIVDENNLRNEEYFKGLRRDISELLKNDQQVRDDLLDAYIQNRDQIDPLLRRYLELGYHRTGGGYGLVGAPISLSVGDSGNFGNPQSTLEDPEASSVSGPSKGKGDIPAEGHGRGTGPNVMSGGEPRISDVSRGRGRGRGAGLNVMLGAPGVSDVSQRAWPWYWT